MVWLSAPRTTARNSVSTDGSGGFINCGLLGHVLRMVRLGFSFLFDCRNGLGDPTSASRSAAPLRDLRRRGAAASKRIRCYRQADQSIRSLSGAARRTIRRSWRRDERVTSRRKVEGRPRCRVRRAKGQSIAGAELIVDCRNVYCRAENPWAGTMPCDARAAGASRMLKMPPAQTKAMPIAETQSSVFPHTAQPMRPEKITTE
jgi:hypothetical protein